MIETEQLVQVDGATLREVVEPEQWDPLVASLGGDDAYLLAGYHATSRHLEPGDPRPVLLHVQTADAQLALPMLVRALPDGSGFDATSAYGYGGAAASGPIDRELLTRIYDAWAQSRGVVASFIRCHPLLDNAALVPASAEVIGLGSTVAWDVSADRGELLPLMHTHHRRAARKADRAELQLRIVEQPSDLTEFRALYDHTMRRQEAAAYYFFPDAYWDALAADGAGGEVVLVDGLLDGDLAASLLCFAHGDALHYHLGASSDAARSIGASNRCFLAAAEWAQARGMRVFHLGGGVGGGTESPLFQFKHRFDPASEPRPFHIAKLVHDRQRYEALAGTTSTAGFFPPWRAPA